MHRITAFAGGLLIAIAACGVAHAQTKVGSVTTTRGSAWTLDGGAMAGSRAKLLNTANFGPGGTVTSSIAITDTAGASGSISASLLAPFNVFFIGYWPNGTFTAGELSALQTWVNAGGTLIATCDDSTYADVCTTFGHTPTTTATPPVTPTAAGATHPLFAGPFGTVPSINMGGTEGYFPSSGGATALGADTLGHPTVMIQSFGAGRVIFLSDVDQISSNYPGTVTSGPTISSNNDLFLANLFAFTGAFPPVLAAAQPVPTLDPVALGLLALLVAGAAFGVKRRRA